MLGIDLKVKVIYYFLIASFYEGNDWLWIINKQIFHSNTKKNPKNNEYHKFLNPIPIRTKHCASFKQSNLR